MDRIFHPFLYDKVAIVVLTRLSNCPAELAVYVAFRRALLFLIGGAGIVLCSSLLLAHSDDTWLVALATELWLCIVFAEAWVAFRRVKSDITEPPPIDQANVALELADADAAREREQRELADERREEQRQRLERRAL